MAAETQSHQIITATRYAQERAGPVVLVPINVVWKV